MNKQYVNIEILIWRIFMKDKKIRRSDNDRALAPQQFRNKFGGQTGNVTRPGAPKRTRCCCRAGGLILTNHRPQIWRQKDLSTNQRMQIWRRDDLDKLENVISHTCEGEVELPRATPCRVSTHTIVTASVLRDVSEM